MASLGSPYARFNRALATGNLMLIRAAAAELPHISLEDATRVCVILRDREPARFEAAAVRWIARFCVERVDVTLEDVDHATRAFALMRRGDPEAALTILQTLCGSFGSR